VTCGIIKVMRVGIDVGLARSALFAALAMLV
jgi:hypothetical protein